LQKHINTAMASPADWMPWNYNDRLQSIGTSKYFFSALPKTHRC